MRWLMPRLTRNIRILAPTIASSGPVFLVAMGRLPTVQAGTLAQPQGAADANLRSQEAILRAARHWRGQSSTGHSGRSPPSWPAGGRFRETAAGRHGSRPKAQTARASIQRIPALPRHRAVHAVPRRYIAPMLSKAIRFGHSDRSQARDSDSRQPIPHSFHPPVPRDSLQAPRSRTAFWQLTPDPNTAFAFVISA